MQKQIHRTQREQAQEIEEKQQRSEDRERLLDEIDEVLEDVDSVLEENEEEMDELPASWWVQYWLEQRIQDEIFEQTTGICGC